MKNNPYAERNLALEAVRVTEAAARAASKWLGRGDERSADEAAVTAMDRALQGLAIRGTIRIGEPGNGDGSLLCVGDAVGTGDGPEMDVALMALEGPTIIARGGPNGLSVIAMTESDNFIDVPDVYMDKIAVGADLPDGIVDLKAEPQENLTELARAKKVDVGELVVCILDRPRHSELVAKVRETGARINLIADGDVSGAIATGWRGSDVDIYMGIGGAPQGVLAAAALACIGGQMQGRLVVRNDSDRALVAKCAMNDLKRTYNISDMASGNVTFAATGVTTGPMLRGVRKRFGVDVTESAVTRSRSGTARVVIGYHRIGHHPKKDEAGTA